MERSASGTFLVFATACFAGYVWSTYCVPETANVSLEEVDAVFGSSAGREDVALKHQVRALRCLSLRQEAALNGSRRSRLISVCMSSFSNGRIGQDELVLTSVGDGRGRDHVVDCGTVLGAEYIVY